MPSTTQTNPPSKRVLWTGRILSGAMIAFMIMDAVMHMTKIDPVVQASARLGFPLELVFGLGIVELVCTILYAYPRTSVLGAVLLTGYLGGAVAMHLRIGSSLFGEMLFPVYIGVLLWGGLYLREPRLHALIPFTVTSAPREPVANFSAATAPQH
jgi:DoxX-like protein